MSAFLSDGTVNLRPVSRADLPQLAAWRNDPEIRARTREFRPLTDVDQERWLQRISGGDRRNFMFVVETPEQFHYTDGKPQDWLPEPVELPAGGKLFAGRIGEMVHAQAIGVVGLCHWDPINASAEVSFYIGDEAERGKGYVTRALQLLHRWGFEDLHLHRIWAEVYDFNKPGHLVLKKLGYTETGSQRDTVWDGKIRRWWSSVVYDLLEHEWRARS